MPSIEVDIEIFCGGCGEGICNNADGGRTRNRQQPCFTVNPCEKCLDNAKKEGEKEGYNEGYEDAQKEFDNAEKSKV